MKLVVDLPDELVGRIRDVVKNGGYDDPREFVETAIENQLELEEGGEPAQFKSLDEAIREYDREQPKGKSPASSSDPELESVPKSDVELRSYEDLVPVDPPSHERIDDGPLWGQYNRLLPVKFVLRRLANVLEDRSSQENNLPSETEHGSFKATVSKDARSFGKRLVVADEKKSRGRGEKFSAGFPTGDKKEKSIDRFESHFVGYSDRNGNLTGAPAALLFVEISASQPSQIGITQAGLEFARIPNPVLDKSIEADDPLSGEERDFYLDHVADTLPEELEAMVHTAHAIRSGDNRPTSLSERVGELDSDWTKAQASTNRSGLVSRMHELNLVDRYRVDQRGIGYELTEDGHAFMKRHT